MNLVSTSQPRRTPAKKLLRIIVALLVVYGALTVLFLKNGYDQALAGKSQLEQAFTYLQSQDLVHAREDIQAANLDFKSAHSNIIRSYLWRPLPWVGTQLKAVNLLLGAGVNLTQALDDATLLSQGIMKEFSDRQNLSYSAISTDDKRKVLAKIASSQAELDQIRNDIDQAIVELDQLPRSGIMSALADKIQPIQDNLPKLKVLADKILPLVITLPHLVGYPDPVTYLVLLENNDELRPTGGFIGTYGVLKMSNGDITYFQTDNIYNLDDPAKTLNVPAPMPLVKYLHVPNWKLRDSNWSPDFPTSAEKAIWFYHQEGGPETKFDGVLAATPSLMSSILETIGAQKVQGLTFTSTNVQEALENQVGKDYYTQGIPEAQRKGIVGLLGLQVKEEILKMPLKKFGEVVGDMLTALDEKQLIIYSLSPNVQQILEQNNWTANVKETSGDYFLAIDTNLASLKTDRVIERKIDYSLEPDGNTFRVKAVLNYSNEGHINWKTTRLRSWTRVYVPKGSELISATGLMENDRSTKPGQVEIGEELGKTYFGGFISVEPGQSSTLTFEYRL
ncbi:DUF4012 domain-containing protein, partial [Candidatus Uhrbacteria bacterium]|nr:DUF4012 domain-containing protein [Candidatus Uhrbacteria bacterium]